MKDQRVKVIARSGEKFITMKVANRFDNERKKFSSGITFVDSLDFLNTSLANLAGNLDTADFVNTKKFARRYILQMDGVIEETLNVVEVEDMVINDNLANDENLFNDDDGDDEDGGFHNDDEEMEY